MLELLVNLFDGAFHKKGSKGRESFWIMLRVTVIVLVVAAAVLGLFVLLK